MMFLHRLIACVLVLLPGAVALAEVYQAPSPEPTPEETLLLEYINRARADPAAEGKRILESRIRIQGDVDKAMFEREMAALEPAPPLVFNLALLDAARKHAHYMILNEQGHDQEQGKPGFTGKSMSDRIRAAGYKGGSMAENAFRTGDNPWQAHAAFEVDWGPGGAGGMQPGRGHRRNIHHGGFREVGPAMLPHGKQFSVVQNFGSSRGRFAGGVVYFDKNGDGFYDLGEGRGGVTIYAGRDKVETWASGAFTLQIPEGEAVTLAAEYDGLRFSKQYPAGSANVKFDFVIPQGHDIDKAKRLIAAVEAIEVNPDQLRSAEARRKAELRLYFGTQGLFLDDGTQEQINTLTAAAKEQMQALQDTVVELMGGDDVVETRRTVYEARGGYRGTPFDDWLADAFACAALLDRQRKLAEGTASSGSVRAMVAELERRRAAMKTDHWRQWLDGLIEQTRGRS